MAYLDKHSTLDLVMVSVVSSIPSGGRQFFAEIFFKAFDVNSDLKCKGDPTVKNSKAFKIKGSSARTFEVYCFIVKYFRIKYMKIKVDRRSGKANARMG